jgi:hypothetical protein
MSGRFKMINTSTLVPAGAARIPDWVSGGSYVVNDQVMSPITFLAYVRKTNGGGVTDPSADATNWTPFGQTIKQIIRGTITITSPSPSNTATISSVDTTKSFIFHLGNTNSSTGSGQARLALTNATTVTATSNGSFSGTNTVSYQVVEYY